MATDRQTGAPTLVVDPIDGLVDTTPDIRVAGAPGGATVTVAMETRDAAGHTWRSRAAYRADDGGTVHLGRDAPVEGDYAGVDPGGLLWSMRFTETDVAPTAYAASADHAEVTVHAEAGGASTSATMTRRWAAVRVRRTTVEGDGFVGRLHEPAEDTGRTPVVVVPGSTGAGAVEPWAALWASHGHPAMVVGYLEEPGLPTTLREVPLEALDAGLRHVAERYGRPPAVLAFSVGTAGVLAMLATVTEVEVAAVIAAAPSHVVWQALGDGGPPPKASSWSRAGAGLPWVPIRGEKLLPQMVGHTLRRLVSRRPRPTALRMREAYAAGLADEAAVAAAAIPVERIAAPLLLISGDADAMWPGSDMAEAILARRRDAGVGERDEHLRCHDAGHFLRTPGVPTTVTWNDALQSGGTPAGVAAGAALAWERMRALVG